MMTATDYKHPLETVEMTETERMIATYNRMVDEGLFDTSCTDDKSYTAQEAR